MPKITQLTADTAPTSDDLTVIVNDPAGTPGTKKATLANVITKAHGLTDGIVSAGSGTLNTTLSLDTDGTLAANSDTRIASQKATKTYTDNVLGNANALVYKGVIDCSTNPNYPAADAGWLYVVSVAGKIGGASGIDVEVGDMAICNTDGTASGNEATVGQYWNIIQKNIVGAVTGPASAVTDNIAVFDGTTGKVIKDGGAKTADFITKALIDAKGDLIVGSADNTPSILTSSGSNGNVLTVDTSTATGLKWAAPTGGGQTLYDKVVATSGGDYTTLQDALAAASAGETIFVRSGTYNLTAITSSSLNDITIIGENPQTATINIGTYRLSLTGTGVTVTNLEFTMANTSSYAFYIANAGSTLRNCVLRSTTRNQMALLRGNVENNFFYNTSATSNSNTLIELTSAETTFKNNYLEYEWVGSGTILLAQNGTVIGNYFNGVNTVNGNTCCAIRGAIICEQNYIIAGGSSTNRGGTAMDNTQAGLTINNNKVEGYFESGIKTGSGGYIRETTINNNVIRLTSSITSGSSYGIYINSGSNFGGRNTIMGNIISNTANSNQSIGIYIFDSTTNGNTPYSIIGNWIQAYGNAIDLSRGSYTIIGNNIRSSAQNALYLASTVTKSTIIGNIIGGGTSTNYNSVINTNGTNSHAIIGNNTENGMSFDGNTRDSLRTEILQNSTGSAINANNVVVLDATAAGVNIKTTTTAGDNTVYGVTPASISNGNWGHVVTSGKVTVNADATTPIVVGDWLSCHTTAGSVKKASAGETAIGRALTALASGTGTVDIKVMTPRLI